MGEASSLSAGRGSLAPTDRTTRAAACKALLLRASYPGSATSLEGALAPGYGSCLLPLRLPSLYSQANRFSVRPKQEVFVRLCLPDPLPALTRPLRIPIANRDLPARSSRQPCLRVLVSSSNRDLKGHWNRKSGPKSLPGSPITPTAADLWPVPLSGRQVRRRRPSSPFACSRRCDPAREQEVTYACGTAHEKSSPPPRGQATSCT